MGSIRNLCDATGYMPESSGFLGLIRAGEVHLKGCPISVVAPAAMTLHRLFAHVAAVIYASLFMAFLIPDGLQDSESVLDADDDWKANRKPQKAALALSKCIGLM